MGSLDWLAKWVTPHMHINQYLPRAVPEALRALVPLALDLRWSWFHGADHLWRTVDAELWEATANPWLILQQISDQRLAQLAQDGDFLGDLCIQSAAQLSHGNAETWFSKNYANRFDGNIAYFSMEFGVSESLPIYSGGLGVLAGDYLKTASDLGIPLVGVGLLYQQGYFRQALNPQGEQIELYPYSDPTMLPIVPLRDDRGEWVHIEIELPGRSVRLRTWRACIGRCSLLLLDSNDPLNDASDRGITSELYGAGTELRLQQEIVLGIGGWRLLEKMGINCPICHLNEGHAAFALLERVRFFMLRAACTFAEALWATRAGNLFTSHTPVAASFDRHPAPLIAVYFDSYCRSLNISINQLLALGSVDARTADEFFIMPYLALHGVGAVNGVSRLHSEVSRRIFQPLFPRWPQAEVPVGYVTNGVHMPSWDSVAADKLWTDACGQARWRGALETLSADLCKCDDTALWQLRTDNRQMLINFVRKRMARKGSGRSAHAKASDYSALLDMNVLTIGFARRFTGYKRPNLLLQDSARLLRLLTNRDRPAQIVIAGKAHPHDVEGKRLLQRWQQFLRRAELQNCAVFIEDYDLDVATQLVQGVDVWLNTPRRPWEACGTSGMKVLVNGGLNVSELDGWWAEAYMPGAGWAFGDGYEHDNIEEWDAREAEQLYRLLEDEIVPCFYQRDEHGLPQAWLERMRNSMAQLTVQYSSNRMAREYVDQYYAPMASAAVARYASPAATKLTQWYSQLAQHWQQIHFGNVTWFEKNNARHCEVHVYLDDLSMDAVQVELYADADGFNAAERIVLERGALLAGAINAYSFSARVDGPRASDEYTPRIIPKHLLANIPLEANFITWYR